MLCGVDVTGSKFLTQPEVIRAAEFAAQAHAHQRRRTGEPYVSHCIATARIVEGLLASSRVQEADDRCVLGGGIRRHAWVHMCVGGYTYM